MTEEEHAMMRFESRWWRLTGSKETAIRAEFGMSATRYYQLLRQLIAREDVEPEYPIIVHRLRRQTARSTRPRTLTLNLD